MGRWEGGAERLSLVLLVKPHLRVHHFFSKRPHEAPLSQDHTGKGGANIAKSSSYRSGDHTGSGALQPQCPSPSLRDHPKAWIVLCCVGARATAPGFPSEPYLKPRDPLQVLSHLCLPRNPISSGLPHLRPRYGPSPTGSPC